MDTPESKTTPVNNSKNKLINPSSSSDSPAFQDSPVFNYISNLSPIQPVKAGPVAQGFPGLASPPLVFTSPRIYSQTSFFNRKLQSSSSTREISQDHENCQKNVRDIDDLVKLDPGYQSQLPPSDQKACNTEKLQQIAHCGLSGCFDDFIAHPEPCAKSSQDRQLDDAPPSQKGGVDGDGKDVGLDASALQKGKESMQSKSRISVKLVKNEARHLLSSSECSGTLPRLLRDHTSEIFQSGDSFSEASHSERGSLRRCLFDESQRKSSAVRSDFKKPISSPQLLESDDKCTGKSGSRQMINLSKHTIDEHISSVTGNHPVAIPKPLGIGLHLNSVVYPRSTDSVISSQQLSVVKVEIKSSLFVANNQSDAKVKASNESGKVPVRSEEIGQQQACLVPTSDNTIASDAVEQSHSAMGLEVKLDASSPISYEKRKFSSNDAENDECSVVAVSPKKKRKRATSSSGDETNKRCNCRKTKCLKLYCDCFAAGFYCGESCACQGCFNKPEYEDTVLETRQQIESRNPLAFAPKVVLPVTGSPAIVEEVGNLSTPSSARHKRGCNCKKSMCLKKYCECYQANVGCSEGCRCEGCKNIYGIREDFSIAREIMVKRASIEMSEGTVVSSDFVSSRAHNSPNLMPITPALLCSDQKNNALKSRLPFRRFLQSPDSHHDILKSGENVGSPRNPQHCNVLLEKIKLTDVGALEAHKASDNPVDIVVPAGDDSIFAPSSQTSDTDLINSNLRNVPQPESIAESCPLPPSNSLRWRSSPITPITQLAASELKDFGSDSKHSDMLEDDTPEILKYSSTPSKSVKVSSPNKKRISPPHNNTNPSESLRCSRKFVLRAVPSFPSLTPYSRNSSNEMRGQSSL